MNKTDKILLGLCLKHSNNWDKVYQDISNRTNLTEAEQSLAESFEGNFITILDKRYPKRLKQRFKPPFVLYYEGDISALELVDFNDCSNDLVFLYGNNCFNIPQSILCTFTSDYKLDICGRLKIWFNKDSQNVDRFGLAAGICNHIVGTKEYDCFNNHSWFLCVTISNALNIGGKVYIKPTSHYSYNNKLIKDGAILMDCLEDLELSKSYS